MLKKIKAKKHQEHQRFEPKIVYLLELQTPEGQSLLKS